MRKIKAVNCRVCNLINYSETVYCDDCGNSLWEEKEKLGLSWEWFRN